MRDLCVKVNINCQMKSIMEGKDTRIHFPVKYRKQNRPKGNKTQRLVTRGEFRPRQTRELPRAVDLKGRLLSYQSY